jgi:hypothetical protein
MNEIQKGKLFEHLSTETMKLAFDELILLKQKTDVSSIESAALAQAFNVGLLAGLNGLLELASIKTRITLTTRKLKHD